MSAYFKQVTFILLFAWLLSFPYAWFAFRGSFLPAALIALAYLIVQVVGEALSPKQTKPFPLLIIGCLGGLFIFFNGQRIAYEKEVADTTKWIRSQDGFAHDPKDNDQVLFNKYIQSVLKDPEASGILGYIEYLKAIGFTEKGSRSSGGKLTHSKGQWVMLSWIWQVFMLAGTAFVMAQARDPIPTEADNAIPYSNLKPSSTEPRMASVSNPSKTPTPKQPLEKERESVDIERTEKPFELKGAVAYPFLCPKPDPQTPTFDLFKKVAAAVDSRDDRQLESLIESGLRPDLRDENGMPILFAFLMDKVKPSIIEKMLQGGVDPKMTDKKGNTILHHLAEVRKPSYGYAVWSDRPMSYGKGSLDELDQIAHRILLSGANPDAQNDSGQTPLMILAQHGSHALFKGTMELKPDVHPSCKEGQTPLMYACMGGESQIDHVKLLLDGGSDPSIRDKLGKTALHHAVKSGAVQVLLILWNRVDASLRKDFLSTALLDAIPSMNLNMVETLISLGADPGASDTRGQSPLYLALEQRFHSSVKPLLQAGADPNQRTANGLCPLHLAASSRQPNTLRLLLEYGGNPESSTEDGRTALSWAVSICWREGMEILVDAGCDPHFDGPHGFTLYMTLARAVQHMGRPDFVSETIDYLGRFNIPINQLDAFGNSALAYLCGARNHTNLRVNECMEIVASFFMKKGADPRQSTSEGSPLQLASQKRLAKLLPILEGGT